MERARRRISVIAVLPGPKNGMTLMTERIVDAMRERFDVRIAEIGRGYTHPGKVWSARKAIQSILAGFKAVAWQPRPDEQLYLVLNSHGGLLYNIWHALVGRLGGFSMVAHHHVWSYLSSRDWRMALLLRILGPHAVHVVACPSMAAALQEKYEQKLQFSFMTPGIIGFPAPESNRTKPSSEEDHLISASFHPQTFTMGMLSNLTMEKGVAEAIATLEMLLDEGCNVKLKLAGPVNDPVAQSEVDNACKEFGNRLEIVGPLYGADKQKFYDQLDAFLFPTKYRNESWGIVLNEALMAGVPVITYQRGCTGYVVGSGGGTVVREEGLFPKIAFKTVLRWIGDRKTHDHARASALRRGEELRSEAEEKLQSFLDGFEEGGWHVDPEDITH